MFALRPCVVAADALVAEGVRQSRVPFPVLVEAARLVQTSGETEIAERVMGRDDMSPEIHGTLSMEEMTYVILCAIAEQLQVGPRDIERHTRLYVKLRAEEQDADG